MANGTIHRKIYGNVEIQLATEKRDEEGNC